MTYPFSGIIVRYIRANQVPNQEAEDTAVLGANAKSEITSAASKEIKDELHVNLWEMGDRHLLDIGVMINDPASVTGIHIDLPWEVNREDVFDLGSHLIGENIVAAIFNEVVHYDGRADKSYATIDVLAQSGVSSKSFVLVRLISDNFATATRRLPSGETVTQLIVNLPDMNAFDLGDQAKSRYVRFRIRQVPEEVYSSRFHQKDRNLLSSSVETRIFDFRINVRRGIPEDILSQRRELSKGKVELTFPEFKTIHLFVTVNRMREMTFDSDRFIGCRSLEDEGIWNNYIHLDSGKNEKRSHSVHDFLAYQWTAKAKIDQDVKDGSKKLVPVKDLVALARFTEVTSSGWKITRFLLLALIFGAAGDVISDLLKNSDLYMAWSFDAVLKHLPWGEVREETAKLSVALALLFAIGTALFVIPKIVTWGREKARRLLGSLTHAIKRYIGGQ